VTVQGDSPAETAPSSGSVFADLSIGLIAADPLVPDQPATLTLLVLNPGNNDAASVLTLQDTLPPGLGFASVLTDGWECAADDGQFVTCTSDSSLPAQTQTQVQLLLTTAPDAAFPLTNTAAIGSPSLDPAVPLPTTVNTLPAGDTAAVSPATTDP